MLSIKCKKDGCAMICIILAEECSDFYVNLKNHALIEAIDEVPSNLLISKMFLKIAVTANYASASRFILVDAYQHLLK